MYPLLVVALLLTPFAPSAPDAPNANESAASACEVWARETSFARSVADHDAAAFAEHLHPDAVFVDGGNRPTRGADDIAKVWAGQGSGEVVLLRWYPDAVDVAADGQLALSRGPYWMEFPKAPPEKRYLQGRFSSTWQRGSDGRWLVVFDGGGGNVPAPATAEQIAALAAAQKPCPHP